MEAKKAYIPLITQTLLTQLAMVDDKDRQGLFDDVKKQIDELIKVLHWEIYCLNT